MIKYRPLFYVIINYQHLETKLFTDSQALFLQQVVKQESSRKKGSIWLFSDSFGLEMWFYI